MIMWVARCSAAGAKKNAPAQETPGAGATSTVHGSEFDMSDFSGPVKGALACARRGWHVTPIAKRQKKPPIWSNYKDPLSNRSTTSIEAIKRFESKEPGYNWAVVPNLCGLWLLDVDGDRGQDSLNALELEYGQLPPTFTVASPRGGYSRHLYFKGVHRFKIGFRPGLDCPHYCVAPLSVRDIGIYRVTDAREPAQAPAWFGDVIGVADNEADADQHPVIELDQPDHIERADHFLIHDAKPSIQGEAGNLQALHVAATLKDFGLSEEKSVERMLELWNPRCVPSWGCWDGPIADRLDVIVHNAWLYCHGSAPGQNTAEHEFNDGTEYDSNCGQIPPESDRQRRAREDQEWLSKHRTTDYGSEGRAQQERDKRTRRFQTKGKGILP
jgi:hypothetical protein